MILFHHFGKNFELENVGLSVSKILGVFVNTLAANDKHSLRNRKNLRLQIQL